MPMGKSSLAQDGQARLASWEHSSLLAASFTQGLREDRVSFLLVR